MPQSVCCYMIRNQKFCLDPGHRAGVFYLVGHTMKATDVQRLLNRAGAKPPLIIDGKIGPKSKSAILAFKKKAGLQANDRIDGKFLSALKSVAAGSAAISSSVVVEPDWLRWARAELGEREVPGKKSNARIIEYRTIGMTTDDAGTEDGSRPWCADFTNAALEASGVHGTRSGMARSFERSDHFVKLSGPALGCIVTFWRESKASGKGHVGFYVGETANRVRVIGGNQADAVSIAAFSRETAKFGISGYYWPAGVPLPDVGAISSAGNDASDVSMV